jgi:signal transduction histidine kinase
VQAEPNLLEAVLRNLLDNAVSYSPRGGCVEVRARREADWIVCDLQNERGELVAKDLPHLFEPSWRKDLARHDEGHSGLGLALAHAWARAFGGTLSVELVEPSQVLFRLRLPAAQRSNSPRWASSSVVRSSSPATSSRSLSSLKRLRALLMVTA